jgi:hypothetical protein
MDSQADARASNDGGSRSISLPNQVTAMAINNTTNTLFAAMVATGKNAGIAVIDTTTNAVTGTMAPPTDDGGVISPYLFDHLMAVDETHNLVYAARQSNIVDVYDGATKAYKTSFDVAALDTNCWSLDGVHWLAIDGSRGRLYAHCGLSSGSNIEIAVIQTSGTPSLAAAMTLTDLQSFTAELALDTTNQRLFASALSLGVTAIHVDEVDTATNQEVAGSQQNVGAGVLGAGTIVATLGGPGYAALVTNQPVPDGGIMDGGTKSIFFSLEPAKVAFQKEAFSLTASAMFPGRYNVIFDFELGSFPVAVVQVSATEGTAPVVTKTGACNASVPPGTTSVDHVSAAGGKGQFYMAANAYRQGIYEMPVGIWVCDDP